MFGQDGWQSAGKVVHICHNAVSGAPGFRRAQRTGFRSNPPAAFTLIELLIVVAIIAILALIAVPNLLEASVRSKVAAVKSDHRTLALALEAYFTDNGKYPEDYAEIRPVGTHGQGRLTTPIAYLTSIPLDVFGGYIDDETGKRVVVYTLGTAPDESPTRWMLASSGPNGIDETSPAFEYPGYSPQIFDNPSSGYRYMRYDPTNGTVSPGDIIRVNDANDISR